MKPQIWLVTGASGLIGSSLVHKLHALGHEVRTLSRNPGAKESAFHWNPTTGEMDEQALEGIDVLVHLAGANIGQRWTKNHKEAILASRVNGTSLLRKRLESHHFEGTWIQASAVGYYGNQSEPCLESASKGSGFLADVVDAWEHAAKSATSMPYRFVCMRLGLVLSPKGGTLARLGPLYKMGLGAPLATGQQAMSWVHLDDVISFVVWASQLERAQGVYNVVAPQHVSNRDFSKTLAAVLNRPHVLPNVPSWALRSIFGEMATLVIEGQPVAPQRLLEAKFEWQFPELKEALKDCVLL